MEVSDENKKLLEKYREDILKRSLSNTENYDRSILTLSASFLGFSLAFIRDLAAGIDVSASFLLPSSWLFFFIAIVVTLVSFQVSERALIVALENAESVYLRNDPSGYEKTNRLEKWNRYCSYGSGATFSFASLLTVIFVTLNLSNMKPTIVQKGASIPKPQSGAAVPGMQLPAPVPAPTPPAPAPAPASK
ncbi:MAG: hypothetical protein EAZ30_10185 [Betaproteobacteria bacterium]|nr:MAG: hypothetical protein EAZ30_10185 [Betaproteobacteria bacterium]